MGGHTTSPHRRRSATNVKTSQVFPSQTPISSPPRQPPRSSDRHLTVILGGMNEHRAPSPDRRWHPQRRRSQARLNSCRPAGEAAEGVICPAECAGGQIPGGPGTRGGDRPAANEPSRWPGDRMPSGHCGCAASGAQTARSAGIHAQWLTAEPLSPAGRLCAFTGVACQRDGTRVLPRGRDHLGS